MIGEKVLLINRTLQLRYYVVYKLYPQKVSGCVRLPQCSLELHKISHLSNLAFHPLARGPLLRMDTMCLLFTEKTMSFIEMMLLVNSNNLHIWGCAFWSKGSQNWKGNSGKSSNCYDVANESNRWCCGSMTGNNNLDEICARHLQLYYCDCWVPGLFRRQLNQFRALKFRTLFQPVTLREVQKQQQPLQVKVWLIGFWVFFMHYLAVLGQCGWSLDLWARDRSDPCRRFHLLTGRL